MASRLLLSALLTLSACGGGGDSGGADLADVVGCVTCHSDTDTASAPTLEGIRGTEVTLEDGRSVTVDETYVRRAIVDPGADIVEGYRTVMPTFPLSDSEVDRLVDWVGSLQ